MALAVFLGPALRCLGHVGAQFLGERAVVFAARAELSAVGGNFRLDTRCAHASGRARWSKNPAARLAAAAGVGKALTRKGHTMMRSSLWFIMPALALAACGTQAGNNAQKAGTEAGIDVAWMDKTVAPGDDFFGYANGTWAKTTEIPADRSSAGAHVIADELREKNSRELFDAIIKANPTGGNDALIANYYKAYANTDALDRAGLGPAKADLDAIAAIADKRALSAAIGGTLRADTDAFNATNFQTENLFGIFVTQGLATPGEQLPYLMQGGLGLPDREYYLSADPKMAELKNKYRAYVAQILTLAGHPDAQGAANRIVNLETK